MLQLFKNYIIHLFFFEYIYYLQEVFHIKNKYRSITGKACNDATLCVKVIKNAN